MGPQPELIETTSGAGRLLRDLARAVWREAVTGRTMLVAAGLAFFALFSLLPAVTAVCGRLVDAEEMQRQLLALRDVLPESVPSCLKRRVFRSLVELQTAINRFVTETNHHWKPFVWSADPDRIIAAVKREHQTLVFIR